MDARGLREAAARARCLRQQHETTAGDPNVPPPPPPPPKNSRRSKGGENARAVAMGPLLAARLRPTGGGHTARTAGMRRTSRSRSIAATPLWIWPRCFPWRACALLPCTTGFTFWPPPQDAAAAAAPCPCAWYASPLLAPATSLSIILIACSPLLPPLRALPRQCLAAHLLLAASEMCAPNRPVRSATALAPLRALLPCTLVASWRGPAAHAGAQTAPRLSQT